MNSKKQTVWLVSMLSLMVVLSAYYLFTEDVKTPDLLTDNTQTGQNGDAAEAGGIVVDEVGREGAAEDTGTDGLSDADREVLERLDAQGMIAGSVFDDMQYKREQNFITQYDKLMATINDSKSSDDEAAAKAAEELNELEDKYAKITDIETNLQQQYNMAVVTEENDRYKVVVQSENLDRSQAVGIVELVMNEMDVEPHQITVQYVP
ncbi:SpoIIIAH-like family protein [Paenibacillus cisolokensis]|jgi:stage III sporulation protein AH|uniref:Stage III sporulation protein AH n=1 Tax=Paenibacillus cisolokensis TaxID=1658519 RepID=A0ABQ4NCF0_9BACL|nr:MULTISPECIES: SpoIIIAH-like family protein [Paenibacillus]ALS28406.1 stage III sporulation protein AH [Paenibacillus sp. 32O-W]GIQ65910.1 hypothetical protein PACILC2_44780 [Paenibacillus cisolokensis]